MQRRCIDDIDLEIWAMAVKTLGSCLHCPLCFIGKERRNCYDGMCKDVKNKNAEAVMFYLTMHNDICDVGGTPEKSALREWLKNMSDCTKDTKKLLKIEEYAEA